MWRHPVTARPAAWVREEDREALARVGVKTWDAGGVVQLATLAALRRHAHELLGIQEAQGLLEFLQRQKAAARAEHGGYFFLAQSLAPADQP